MKCIISTYLYIAIDHLHPTNFLLGLRYKFFNTSIARNLFIMEKILIISFRKWQKINVANFFPNPFKCLRIIVIYIVRLMVIDIHLLIYSNYDIFVT